MKSPPSQLVAALVLLAVVLIGCLRWYHAVSAESAVVASLNTQINTKTATAARIASAHTALSAVATDESLLRSYFIDQSAVVPFIDNLEARGITLKTTVNILSVGAGTTADRPTLSLSLTIQGTFNNVMRTVGSIEYAPYDLSITTLSLGQDSATSWHADINLLVGLTTSSTSAASSSSSTPGVVPHASPPTTPSATTIPQSVS